MYEYLVEATVLPERASISLSIQMSFQHMLSKRNANATVSVRNNKAHVRVYTPDQWNIFDLRNVVVGILRTELSLIGYAHGQFWHFDVYRISCPPLGVDFVFGNSVECVVEKSKSVISQEIILMMQKKMYTPNGIVLQRSLEDFGMAMSGTNDIGFYCYRAIESLRQYCRREFQISEKKDQWEKVRLLAECSEATILEIKDAADPTRHGDIHLASDEDSVKLLNTTWDILLKFFQNC